MSYTGSFATEDLYEVAKNGDPEKGSWVTPIDRAHDIADSDFVKVTDDVTGELRPVVHKRGTFVFRLSGRERQQSASYYTPEVLTKFTVSQALEELLDQDGHTTTAAEILRLSVCEPALGSGAFAIEAVRQVADQYLRRREHEVGEKVDPEVRPQVLQRIKAWSAASGLWRGPQRDGGGAGGDFADWGEARGLCGERSEEGIVAGLTRAGARTHH